MFFNVTTPKFAAQAIKKAHEIGWKPVHLLNNVSNSVGSVIKPAGLEASKGVLSTGYLKDPTDPTWNNDAGKKEWLAFMDKYFPEGDKTSSFTVYGYTVAQTLVEVLKKCGDDLTRDNVMKQAASLKSLDASDAAARHHHQHQRQGLRADQADADAEVQRRALGAVRPGDDRRRRELSTGLIRSSPEAVEDERERAAAGGRGTVEVRRAPAPQSAGVLFFIRTFQTCQAISPTQTTSRVTAIGRV